MTLGVSPAAAARAAEGSEEAKQHVRAPTVRPMGGRRSQHKILPPSTAASLASFDGRDCPSTPDGVEVAARTTRGSWGARGADARGDDLRAAASAHEQSSIARRLDASASPAALAGRARDPPARRRGRGQARGGDAGGRRHARRPPVRHHRELRRAGEPLRGGDASAAAEPLRRRRARGTRVTARVSHVRDPGGCRGVLEDARLVRGPDPLLVAASREPEPGRSGARARARNPHPARRLPAPRRGAATRLNFRLGATRLRRWRAK